ncbi:MAG: salicylate hydroxylase [Cryomorphaceae bacterium]|jgi:salicylate hydroxylase
MKVLIAGAGIGGLSTALCLLKSGHEVQVFEQAPAVNEVGAGLQCGANALHVMEHLGLLEQIQSLAVDPQSVQFRHYKSGEILHTMALGGAYANKYGAPYLHIHRADLIGILLRALQDQVHSSTAAHERLVLNARVSSYKELSDSVNLQLDDGRTFSGDCLVAADGVKSLIRDQLLGEHKPNFTGMVAWRGVVPVDRLPANWMDKLACNFMGPNKHVVLYYLRKQQLANFVGIVENPECKDDSWVSNAPWQELKADFEGWHPTVQTIIDAMDKQHCYRWALYNHQPFNNWSSDRVTLLGDAAHSTLPFMASGAAMAIEDARILQRGFDQSGSVAQALSLYQRNRMQRTAKIQKRSSQMGSLYHIKNKLALKVAFTAIGLFGARDEDFLPNYNANTIELI